MANNILQSKSTFKNLTSISKLHYQLQYLSKGIFNLGQKRVGDFKYLLKTSERSQNTTKKITATRKVTFIIKQIYLKKFTNSI